MLPLGCWLWQWDFNASATSCWANKISIWICEICCFSSTVETHLNRLSIHVHIRLVGGAHNTHTPPIRHHPSPSPSKSSTTQTAHIFFILGKQKAFQPRKKINIYFTHQYYLQKDVATRMDRLRLVWQTCYKSNLEATEEEEEEKCEEMNALRLVGYRKKLKLTFHAI